VCRKRRQIGSQLCWFIAFGHEPQLCIPQAEVTCIRFRGLKVTRGYQDRQDLRGTIPELIDQAVTFVRHNMRVGGYVWGIKRTDYYEYPLKAVREAVTNALVHRDYSKNGCVCVYILDDRIEFSSPGRIPPDITLQQIQRFEHRSRPRNHLLTHILRDMEYLEEAGTELKLMATEMVQNGLEKPTFQEFESELRTYFKGPGDKFMADVEKEDPIHQVDKKEATIAEILKNLSDHQRKIVEYTQQHGKITNLDYRQLFNTTRQVATKNLTTLARKEILEKRGSGKNTFYVIKTRVS